MDYNHFTESILAYYIQFKYYIIYPIYIASIIGLVGFHRYQYISYFYHMLLCTFIYFLIFMGLLVAEVCYLNNQFSFSIALLLYLHMTCSLPFLFSVGLYVVCLVLYFSCIFTMSSYFSLYPKFSLSSFVVSERLLLSTLC